MHMERNIRMRSSFNSKWTVEAWVEKLKNRSSKSKKEKLILKWRVHWSKKNKSKERGSPSFTIREMFSIEGPRESPRTLPKV